MDKNYLELLNQYIPKALIGGKAPLNKYNKESFLQFEKEQWQHCELYLRSYSGKLQLLRYNYQNAESIIESIYDEKKSAVTSEEMGKVVRQNIQNGIYSNLILDANSLYVQLLEQFCGLIFSLQANKESGYFWIPFIFCDRGNDSKKDILSFEPYNLHQVVKVFYNDIFKSKQPTATLKKLIDIDYVFFANIDFDFLKDPKEKKKIVKKISDKLVNHLMFYIQHDAYNAWKHRSRAFTGTLPLDLIFHLNDGTKASTPLKNEIITWYELQDESIIQVYTILDISEKLMTMGKVLTAAFNLIYCHRAKHIKRETGSFQEIRYRLDWLD